MPRTNEPSSLCCFCGTNTAQYVDWASLPLAHAHISSPACCTSPVHTLLRHDLRTPMRPRGHSRSWLRNGRGRDVGRSRRPCSCLHFTFHQCPQFFLPSIHFLILTWHFIQFPGQLAAWWTPLGWLRLDTSRLHKLVVPSQSRRQITRTCFMVKHLLLKATSVHT